ncbi:MAG TPA: hypothetical protein VF008_30595 [Niastella sp.]
MAAFFGNMLTYAFYQISSANKILNIPRKQAETAFKYNLLYKKSIFRAGAVTMLTIRLACTKASTLLKRQTMNVRLLFTIGTVVFFSHTTTAQSSNFFIDTLVNNNYKYVSIGYPEDRRNQSEVSPDSVLNIVKISKSAFVALSKNYSPTITYDTSAIIRTKRSFTIKNGHFKQTFTTDQESEFTYAGIIAPLNLYVVHTAYLQQEIASAEFIDYRTGKSYEIPSCANEGTQDILISPQHGTLLTYSNSDFLEGSCCINLLKIKKNPKKQRYTMKTTCVINFDRMNIQKLVWVNEKCFAMEVTEREHVEYDNDHITGKKKKYFLKVNLR